MGDPKEKMTFGFPIYRRGRWCGIAWSYDDAYAMALALAQADGDTAIGLSYGDPLAGKSPLGENQMEGV